MATPASTAAAKKRLAKLDAEAAGKKDKIKRKVLRSKVAMGDRKTRKKAASELSGMSKPKQQN